MKKHTYIVLSLFALFIVALFIDKESVTFMQSIKLFGFVSLFFAQGFFFIVLLVAITSALMWKKDRKHVFLMWISFFASIVLALIIKLIVARERPQDIGLIPYSFPSIHMAAAFSIIPLTKKFYWFWLAFAVIIGLTRLYSGYNYLSDLAAGALIGYACAWFLIFFKKFYLWK